MWAVQGGWGRRGGAGGRGGAAGRAGAGGRGGVGRGGASPILPSASASFINGASSKRVRAGEDRAQQLASTRPAPLVLAEAAS